MTLLTRSALSSSSWGVTDLRALWTPSVEEEAATALRDARAGLVVDSLSAAASELVVRSLQTRCCVPYRKRAWGLCAAAARLPLRCEDADRLASYPAASAAAPARELLSRSDHHLGRTLAITRHLWPLRGNALLDFASLPGAPLHVLSAAGHPERCVTALLPLWRGSDWDRFERSVRTLAAALPESLEVLSVLVSDELGAPLPGAPRRTRSCVAPRRLEELCTAAAASVS